MYESSIEECKALLKAGGYLPTTQLQQRQQQQQQTPLFSPRVPLGISAGGGLSDFGIPYGGVGGVGGSFSGRPVLSRPSSGRQASSEPLLIGGGGAAAAGGAGEQLLASRPSSVGRTAGAAEVASVAASTAVVRFPSRMVGYY